MEGNEESLTRTSSVLEKVRQFEASSGAPNRKQMNFSSSTESSERMSHTSVSGDPEPVTELNVNVEFQCEQPQESNQEKQSSRHLKPTSSGNDSRLGDTNRQPPKPAPRLSPRLYRPPGSASDKSDEVERKVPKPLPRKKFNTSSSLQCPIEEIPGRQTDYCLITTLEDVEPHTTSSKMSMSKSDFNISYKLDGPEPVSPRLQPPTPSPRPFPRVRHVSETLPSHSSELKHELHPDKFHNEAMESPKPPMPQFLISSPDLDECSLDEGPHSSSNEVDYTQTSKLPKVSTLTPAAPTPPPRVRQHAKSMPFSRCESQVHNPTDCQISLNIKCRTDKGNDLVPPNPSCHQLEKMPGPDRHPKVLLPKQSIQMEDPVMSPKPQSTTASTKSGTHQVHLPLQTECSTGTSNTHEVSEMETSPPLIPPKPPSMISRRPEPVPPQQAEGQLASESVISRSGVEFSTVSQSFSPEAELFAVTQSAIGVKKYKPPVSSKPNKKALQARKFISSNLKRVQKKFERILSQQEKSGYQLEELSADEDFVELPEDMKLDFCEEFLVSAEMTLNRLLQLDEFSSASDPTAMKQVLKQMHLKKISISVFGNHNAGKSTVLNVLLGARCLPVANTNETSVRVSIEHDGNVHEGFCPQGKECKACPWISEDSEVSARGITDIYEFLRSINGHARQCKQEGREYTIHAHVPMIATTKELKICFEDTPGFGEADQDSIIQQAETALSGSSAYLYIMPYDQIDDGRNVKAFKSIHGRDKGAFKDGRVLIVITHFDKHYEMKPDDDEDDEDEDGSKGDESLVSTPKAIVSAVHDGVHKATGVNISQRNIVLVSGLWALHSLMLRNNTKKESDVKQFTLWKLEKYAHDCSIDEYQWKEKSLQARLWDASGITAVIERINNLVKSCFELWIKGLHGKCEKFLQFAEETVQGNAENFKERDLRDMETEYTAQKEKAEYCEQYEQEMKCLLTLETSPAYRKLLKYCSEDTEEPHKSAWEVVERHYEDFSSKCKQKYKQKYTQDDFESDVASFLTEKASPCYLDEFKRNCNLSRELTIKSEYSEELGTVNQHLIRATCDLVGKSHDQGVSLDNKQEPQKKGPRAHEVITSQELDLEELKDKLPAPTFKRDVLQYIIHMMTLGFANDGRRVDVEEPLKRLHDQLTDSCTQYRSSITQTLAEHLFRQFQGEGERKLRHYHQIYDEDLVAAQEKLHKQMKDVEEAYNSLQNMGQLVFYCSRMRTHLSRMKRDLLQSSLTELNESDASAEDGKNNRITDEVCVEIQHELDESADNNPRTADDKQPVSTKNQHENEVTVDMDSPEEHAPGQLTVYYPEGSVKEVKTQSGTTLRALLLSSAAESEEFLSEHEPYIDGLKIDWESDCTSLSEKKIVLVQRTTSTDEEGKASGSVLLTGCPTSEDEPIPRTRTQVITKRTFFFRSSKRRSQGGIAAIKLIDNQKTVALNNTMKLPDEVINTFEEDFKNPDLFSTCQAIKHRLKDLQQEHRVLNLVSSELLGLWEESDEKRICIAVFGYHKTGKSTFINALAGIGLLPVSPRKETERKVNLQHNGNIHHGPCKKSCPNCQVLLQKDETACSEVARGKRIASTLHDIHKKTRGRVIQEQGEYIIQANIPCISAVPPPWQVYLQDNPSFSVVTDESTIRNLRDDIVALSLYIYLVRYDQLDDSINAGALKVIVEQDLAKAAGLEKRLLIVVTHFEAYYDEEDYLDEKSLKAKVCKLIKDAYSREFPPDNVIPVCTLWACKGQQLSHQLENEDLKLDALLSLESCYAKSPKGSTTPNAKDMTSSELAESLIAVSGIKEVETKVSQMACSFSVTSALTLHDGFSHYLGAAARKVEDLKTKLSGDSTRKELKRRTKEVRNCLDDFKHGPKSAVYKDLLLQSEEQTATLSAKLLQKSKVLLASLCEECSQSIEENDEGFTREKLLSEFTTLATKLENMQEEVLHASVSFTKVMKCFENCCDAVDGNYNEVCKYVSTSQHTEPQALPAVKLEPEEIFSFVEESMNPLHITREDITANVELPQQKIFRRMLRKKWYTSEDQIEKAFSTFDTLLCGKISTYTHTMGRTITQAVFGKFCKYADAKLKEFDKNFADLLKDDEEEMRRLTAWNEHIQKLQQHLKMKFNECLADFSGNDVVLNSV